MSSQYQEVLRVVGDVVFIVNERTGRHGYVAHKAAQVWPDRTEVITACGLRSDTVKARMIGERIDCSRCTAIERRKS